MPQGETEQGEQQQIKIVLERGKARMLDPIGQSVLVDQDKVRDALKQGYTVETPEHVQQREIAQEKTREREEQYTTAAIIGGIVVLIAGLKFLHFLGMKKSLMLGGAILLAIAFFGAFGFFGQLFAGGLVLVLIAAKLLGPRTVVIVDERPRRRSTKNRSIRKRQVKVLPKPEPEADIEEEPEDDFEGDPASERTPRRSEQRSSGTLLWFLFLALGSALVFAMMQ